jgi:phage-related tail protein
MATKPRSPAGGTAGKPRMVNRKIDGVIEAAADRVKSAKPIENLIAERDRLNQWWQDGEKEIRRLNKRIEQLENALTAVLVVADAAKSSSRYDDDLPF